MAFPGTHGCRFCPTSGDVESVKSPLKSGSSNEKAWSPRAREELGQLGSLCPRDGKLSGRQAKTAVVGTKAFCQRKGKREASMLAR